MEVPVFFVEVIMTVMAAALGWVAKAVSDIRQDCALTRAWHEPDSTGRQTWKSDPKHEEELMASVRNLVSKLDRLITLYEAHAKRDHIIPE